MLSNDLIDFVNSSAREISEEYNRIQKRATEDPGTAGDQGEENWATLLKKWLPHTFHIVTKGRILNHEGVASPQVDIIVLKPEYPQYLLDKKLYLEGGILAVFECKITLKTIHIKNFIENSRIIKSSQPKRFGTPYRELQSRILFGLLAHSHSWKGTNSNPIQNIREAIKMYDDYYIGHPSEMPDFICIADLAFISSTKLIVIDNDILQKEDTNIYIVSSYIHYSFEMENQSLNFTAIGSFLTSLYYKLAWEVPSLQSLAQYFVLAKVGGSGEGVTRKWNNSIFSEELKRNSVGRKFINGEKWNEWSMKV